MHYSSSTEDVYVYWIKRFILFHDKKHPKDMSVSQVENFLSHLASSENVAASTQNQALYAILFLYKTVMGVEFNYELKHLRAKKPKRFPNVLTREETLLVLRNFYGSNQLMARIIYGGGLRLMDCVRVRVKDVDVESKCITIKGGKGGKDRYSVLPVSLLPELKAHLLLRKELHAIGIT